jgi:CubicO group peptidase (beta-lactamase class C family)
MRKIMFLLPLLLAISLQLSSQKQSKEFDAILNEAFEEDGTGAAVIIARDGEVLYRNAVGMANLELGVEMSPDHVFRIGSITKQFTACAILKLAEEGKLDLQDDITKYIEDYPTHGHTITIEHLLTHTSGIKSYTSMEEWTAEVRKKDFTPAEMVDFFKNQPIDFAPGEKWVYNNSAYFLLGYIVELVSGTTYESYIDSTFFKPLGMNNSYYGSTSRIIPKRADGYAQGKDGLKNDDFLSMTQPYGAGSLLSTVDDLYIWYSAVFNLEVISASSLKKATTQYELNSGKKTGYGYAWFIGNIQGRSSINHGGGINGYLSASMFLPEEKLFVAVFSNCTCKRPGGIAEDMAAIALGKPFEWKSISLDDELLKSYEAVFASEYDGELIIQYRDGKVFAMRTGGSEIEITAFEKDKFFVLEGTSTFHFVRNSSDEIVAVISKGTSDAIEWKRTDKAIPRIEAIEVDETRRKEYLGKYGIAPEFILTVFAEEGKLYVQASGQGKVEIIPVALDEFKIMGVDAKLVFERGADGHIEHLILHQNGEHKARKLD